MSESAAAGLIDGQLLSSPWLDPDVVGDGDPYPLKVIEARGPSAMCQGLRGRLRTGSPVAKRILDPNLGCVVMLRGALKVVIW